MVGSDSEMSSNKKLIADFYEAIFNKHRIDETPKYMKEDYIQHNPGVGQGRKNFMDAFREKFMKNPTFRLEIKFMIEENDMVAVYLKNVSPSGDTLCRVVDIYRIENGLLAEHWDVLQPVAG